MQKVLDKSQLTDQLLLRPALHSKQAKEDWTPYLGQIEQKISQLGGLERPEEFHRQVGEEQGKYIVDGEEPL